MQMAVTRLIVVAAALFAAILPAQAEVRILAGPAERSDRLSSCSIKCAKPASGW